MQGRKTPAHHGSWKLPQVSSAPWGPHVRGSLGLAQWLPVSIPPAPWDSNSLQVTSAHRSHTERALPPICTYRHCYTAVTVDTDGSLNDRGGHTRGPDIFPSTLGPYWPYVYDLLSHSFPGATFLPANTAAVSPHRAAVYSPRRADPAAVIIQTALRLLETQLASVSHYDRKASLNLC